MVTSDEQVAEQTTPAPALSLDAFSATDWLLLVGTALTWGSSFVWIEVGLEFFAPTLITFLRIALGAATLAFFSKARAKVEREDLAAIALLGVLWMAAPFLLFPIAQQWIDSSLAGMINGGVPIFAGVVAALLLRRLPPPKTVAGLLVGFAGVVAVSWPAVQGSSATALGAGLVVLATLFYGISLNIAVPLQQRYGPLPVVLRVQLVSLVLTIGPGIYGATRSNFDWVSFAAMIPLGCLGTGLAFVWMSTLVGRVGAARGSVTIYFVPVIAIALGALFRNESISPISLLGTALVIGGAFLASRVQQR
ncbi:MAG: DMT family transporter [Actinomycetota bacterium]|nr:DMT family transporter [Actinomycetota bacterium]